MLKCYNGYFLTLLTLLNDRFFLLSPVWLSAKKAAAAAETCMSGSPSPTHEPRPFASVHTSIRYEPRLPLFSTSHRFREYELRAHCKTSEHANTSQQQQHRCEAAVHAYILSLQHQLNSRARRCPLVRVFAYSKSSHACPIMSCSVLLAFAFAGFLRIEIHKLAQSYRPNLKKVN